MNPNQKQPNNQSPKPQPNNKRSGGDGGQSRGASRGAAIRAQSRTQDDAHKALSQYTSVADQERGNEDRGRANKIIDYADRLKISFLGGQEAIGEKNMQILEWQNDAIILDCGNHLGIDLPGVNYSIADTVYLDSIRHKIRGYVITHGHLDHLGGLKHIVPKYPAPIYGSRFTLGVVQKTFEDLAAETGESYEPKCVVMN